MDTEATPQRPAAPKSHEFEFTGNGSEYFRIWIVNLLLSILTLGIYSAWATVRRKRYFYGNTHVLGSSFEYHAAPTTILKGRLVAVAVLATLIGLGTVSPPAQGVMLLALAPLVPFLIVRSRVFNAVNTSWRNVRLGFRRNYGSAYAIYLLWPLLIPFTLGLIYPYISYLRNRFLVANSVLGEEPFRFEATAGGFYKRLLGIFFLWIIAFFLLSMLIGFVTTTVQLSNGEGKPTPQAGHFFNGMAALFYLTAFVLGVVGRTVILNYVWSSARIRDGEFRNALGINRMVWITLSNLVLIVLTLGLFTPWASVRLARYRAHCMSVFIAEETVSELTAAAERRGAGALGDEAVGIFDLEVGAI